MTMADQVGADQLGARVVVRRAVGGGAYVDLLGHVVGLDDAHVELVTGRGENVTVPLGEVAAAKPVPPPPVRRGWEVPEVSPERLQQICSAGWPAEEVEALGDWQLRAHRGITGRANSVMAVGDPGMLFDDALLRVAEWYAARDLPVLMQQPLGGPVDRALAHRGWPMLHVTIVQVAPIRSVLEALPVRSELRTEVATGPSAEWRSLMHDLDERDPEGHLAILTGTPRVGFATVSDDEQALGIGRVSIEGEWAGVTSVDVSPAARRRGIGTAVMRALLGWADAQGAVASYLQVRARNEPALGLYARLGYRTHHPYCYRVPPS